MSKEAMLKMAKYHYRRFIRSLSPSLPRNVQPGDFDPESRPQVRVKRADAVDCFLIKSPRFTEFRAELLAVRNSQDEFLFVEEKWRKTNEK